MAFFTPFRTHYQPENTATSIKHQYPNSKIKLQAMQDAPPLHLYPASDKFLM